MLLLAGMTPSQRVQAGPSAPDASLWTNVASMNTARQNHTATLLLSGKVLVAGGISGLSALASVEVYDPDTNTWSSVASLNAARYAHTATLLPSGEVLVVGGYNGSASLAGVEVYNPDSNTWTSVASLNTARRYHSATLLPSGKVLVAGGWTTGGGELASAEVYDSVTDTWASVDSLNIARARHTATLLPSGKVLITGGSTDTGQTASAEVYDPESDTWTTVASLSTARYYHTATLLPSGKVLVAGGYNGSATLVSVQVYDPAVNTWTDAAALNVARYQHTVVLLSSGKLLVAGGNSGSAYLTSAELYNPAMNTWTLTGSLSAARNEHAAVLLATGKLLVVGGYNDSVLASAERYDPGLGFNDAWRPVVETPATALGLGDALSLSGSGFRGYQFGEASNGASNSSATNYPLVQLRRLDNEQVVWLTAASFSETDYTLLPVTGIARGPARVTVFINGIPSLSQPIQVKAASTMTLVASPGSSTYGESVAFIAIVTSSEGTPTGTVTFKDGGTVLGTGTPSGNGIARYSTAALLAGMHTITAEYGGDANFATSSGALIGSTFTVNQAVSLTALAASANPSSYGQSVTFTATVTSSEGTPTGTVTFKDGATTLGTGTLSGGIASYSTAGLALGMHAITAEYGGDTNFIAGTSAMLTHNVEVDLFLPLIRK